MAAPTLADYQQSTYSDQVAAETTPTVTWQTGDIILVTGVAEDSTHTIGTPTATGLTFNLLTSIGQASNTICYMWSATAGSSSSGAITATGTAEYKGISAFVYRGSAGLGTPVTMAGSAAKVISLTRAQANSAAVVVMGDWAAGTDVTVTTVPSGGVQRVAHNQSGRATFWVISWGDQGATGTSDYGFTDSADTVDMNGIVVEVKGTASGTAALTGTATASITEADVVTGGKTIILTLTGDTYIAAGTGPIGSIANTTDLINGIDSAQAEATGWDTVVKASLITNMATAVVVDGTRTICTITLTANATYNITAQETITATIPAAVLTLAAPIVASPTFTVDIVAAGAKSYYYQANQ